MFGIVTPLQPHLEHKIAPRTRIHTCLRRLGSTAELPASQLGLQRRDLDRQMGLAKRLKIDEHTIHLIGDSEW
jgi:transcriptional regulator with GAF, ATPase, and Fis domain